MQGIQLKSRNKRCQGGLDAGNPSKSRPGSDHSMPVLDSGVNPLIKRIAVEFIDRGALSGNVISYLLGGGADRIVVVEPFKPMVKPMAKPMVRGWLGWLTREVAG